LLTRAARMHVIPASIIVIPAKAGIQCPLANARGSDARHSRAGGNDHVLQRQVSIPVNIKTISHLI